MEATTGGPTVARSSARTVSQVLELGEKHDLGGRVN